MPQNIATMLGEKGVQNQWLEKCLRPIFTKLHPGEEALRKQTDIRSEERECILEVFSENAPFVHGLDFNWDEALGLLHGYDLAAIIPNLLRAYMLGTIPYDALSTGILIIRLEEKSLLQEYERLDRDEKEILAASLSWLGTTADLTLEDRNEVLRFTIKLLEERS